MSTHLSITKTLDYRETSRGNEVIKSPIYLIELFGREYSPIKTLLATIEAPSKIIINIDVEIIKE